MPAPSRLVGVDAARGLAIVGMLWAHVAPDGTDQALADGRSAVLFAVLAGVSLGLVTGGPRRVDGDAARRALLSVLLRGFWLVALGLGLAALGTPIAVILDDYGVLFVVLSPLLLAPRPLLAAAALVSATLGALLVATTPHDPSNTLSVAGLAHLPTQWFVTGYYPGVVFAAYLLAGLCAARSDLGARRTQRVLVVGGAVASLAGYGGALLLGQDASSHSDTTFEVLGSGGLALAVIGLLQLASAAAPVRAALAPLADAGSMPLTIYTGQLVLLAVWLLTPLSGVPRSIASWPLLAVLVAGSLVFAVLWRRHVGRGPMETVLGGLTGTGSRRAQPSS